MTFINQKHIKEMFLKHLSPLEYLMAIGVFKKVPQPGTLLLTRGLACLFSEVYYVAVTNWRLILLPDPNQGGSGQSFGPVRHAGFDETAFFDGPFQNTILEIQKHKRKGGLRLCFKPGYDFMGSDKYDFIAAVKMGQAALIAAQPYPA